MNEIGELVRIAYKEDRSVVSHQIPVAFLGVKLQRESAHVPFSVGSACLSCHSGEAGKYSRFLSRHKNFGLCITYDISGNLERAVSTPALGMDGSLRNPFAILVG